MSTLLIYRRMAEVRARVAVARTLAKRVAITCTPCPCSFAHPAIFVRVVVTVSRPSTLLQATSSHFVPLSKLRHVRALFALDVVHVVGHDSPGIPTLCRGVAIAAQSHTWSWKPTRSDDLIGLPMSKGVCFVFPAEVVVLRGSWLQHKLCCLFVLYQSNKSCLRSSFHAR